jgi:hypothetical protein
MGQIKKTGGKNPGRYSNIPKISTPKKKKNQETGRVAQMYFV